MDKDAWVVVYTAGATTRCAAGTKQANEIEVMNGEGAFSGSHTDRSAAKGKLKPAAKTQKKIDDLRKGFATLHENIILLEQFRACSGCSLIGLDSSMANFEAQVLALAEGNFKTSHDLQIEAEDGKANIASMNDILDLARETKGPKAGVERHMPEIKASDFGLTDKQLNEFWEAFSLFDDDGNGTVDNEELKEVMQNLGMKPSEDELVRLINEIDVDGDGCLDFEEFVSMMARRARNLDKKTKRRSTNISASNMIETQSQNRCFSNGFEEEVRVRLVKIEMQITSLIRAFRKQHTPSV